ncbi:Alpha/Beta hydrolase protein [Lenzites betulinus]|nr:Alpha/Beta hydrolase protein [Lenzites betulinus]
MLEELDALLTVELPAGPIVLVAHSAGTILAARWLLSSFLAHQRVTHVVFIGGPLDVPTPPSQSQMRLRMADTLEKEGPSVTTDGSLLFLLGKTSMASRPLAVALIRAITLAQDRAAYGAAIRAFDKELSPDSGKIDWGTLQARYKALTIIGDEDLFVAASDVPRYLDQSVVRTIIGVGHSPTVEAPEETAQIIASFMTGA